MNLRVLIIDQADRDAIKKLIAYAESHTFSLKDLKAMKSLAVPPPGDDPNFRADIGEFRCVFTVEEQPIGMCRHLSVSVQGEAPDPAAVLLFMEEFGFYSNLNNASGIWLESIPELDCPKKVAVNVIEKINKEKEELCLPS